MADGWATRVGCRGPPGLIVASQHVSTRYLHRWFEPAGVSVGRYVRGRRLEQCRRDLASFRSAFGLSPRAYRASQRSILRST